LIEINWNAQWKTWFSVFANELFIYIALTKMLRRQRNGGKCKETSVCLECIHATDANASSIKRMLQEKKLQWNERPVKNYCIFQVCMMVTGLKLFSFLLNININNSLLVLYFDILNLTFETFICSFLKTFLNIGLYV